MSGEPILIVTRNFPPLTGGMERLMKHTADALAERFDVTLIGPTGCRKHCENVTQVIECPPSPAAFLFFALFKGLLHCLGRRYRYVLGGSGLVAPITSILARICGARSAVYVHGLDLVVHNSIYQRLFVPWISRNSIVIANSRNTRDLAVSKGCDPGQVSVLNPGTAIPHENTLSNGGSIRESLGLGDCRVVLFVGRMIKRKGLTPFLMHSWPGITAAEPKARLLVVGDTPEHALVRDPGEAAELQKALDEHELTKSVHFLGAVDDAYLWQCYALADVLVFPLVEVEGDIEGFGMVAIEAAAAGTPTVAFPIGGVVDAVVDGVNGRLVKALDYAAFSAAVVETMAAEPGVRRRCREHAQNFSWERHKEKLLGILLPGPKD